MNIIETIIKVIIAIVLICYICDFEYNKLTHKISLDWYAAICHILMIIGLIAFIAYQRREGEKAGFEKARQIVHERIREIIDDKN